jgi:CheY-like chemotaxis protein
MPTRPLQKILYVEDDEDIQRIVRMSLERIGKLSVEIVGNSMNAIEAMKAYQPDLVMLDWMMPEMDGPTLFRMMKEDSAVADLPVVFITAKASSRELEELNRMGAKGTISKPFSPKDLPDQLRTLWDALPD